MTVLQHLAQHRYFRRNRLGRDFVVGDLHGQYPLLEAELAHRRFDARADRVFALGDLCDRGPSSERVLELLREPWFFSVLGNHELMLLEGRASPAEAELHRHNGGDWFYALTDAEQTRLMTLLVQQLALAFTVETAWGRAGLIHATAPADWALVQEVPLEPDHWRDLVWDREDYNRACHEPGLLGPVRGIDAVLHGHVSCEAPRAAANRLWIDTLYRGGRITLMQMDEVPAALG